MRLKMKNRSHRYDIISRRLRHGHKNIKYKNVSQYNDGYTY